LHEILSLKSADLTIWQFSLGQSGFSYNLKICTFQTRPIHDSISIWLGCL